METEKGPKIQEKGARTAAISSVLSRTKGIMRRHLWVWPLIAAALLLFVAIWVRGQMEDAIKAQLSGNLRTILAANVEALRGWLITTEGHAELLASDERLRTLTLELIEVARQGNSTAGTLMSAPQNTALRGILKPIVETRGFIGYVIVDTNFLVLASGREQIIGMQSSPAYVAALQRCLRGESLVTHPYPSVAHLPDGHGQIRAGVPTMFAAAPIRADDGKILAILGLRIAPEKDFTRILRTARSGETGETYAFNRNGLMLSGSRFEDELKKLSLIPDAGDAHSILTVEIRDPQVDLRKGKSSKRRTEMPLTRAVTEAIARGDGLDLRGYRDYRGVPVVGAWTWLQELDLGLVTEMDVAEAYRPVWITRVAFGFLFVLLVLGAIGIFVLMRLANRLQESAQKAALKAQQLGQYALETKIGAGAFGSVYLARHALMRRPVAVKLLDTAQASESSIIRFEREVQSTSQLTHPHTIAIYDYGRTPEGLFYYAMEYLDGLSLNDLVNKFGRQPEGRVIYILRQVCESLAEAHDRDLVHRDIKPHNIFLTRRGNIPDFVKVLDFGLVKARNEEGTALTIGDGTLGTPLYMSPEAVERPAEVDARSDLYSVGAVGFFLLTGEPVFAGATIGEILLQHVRTEPQRPSLRLDEPVSNDLEAILMRCLEKNPSARPGSARELEEKLSRCSAANSWNRENAERWWKRFDASKSDVTADMLTTKKEPTGVPVAADK